MISRLTSKFYNFIYSIFYKEELEKKEDTIRYVLTLAATVVSVIPHIAFLIIFLTQKIYDLLYVNIASVILSYISYLFIKKFKFSIAGVIMAVEISGYSIISTYFLGNDSYVILYAFTLLNIQFLIHFYSKKIRFFIIIMIFFTINAVVFLDKFSVPVYTNYEDLRVVLSFVNANFIFLAFVVMFTIEEFATLLVEKWRLDNLNKLQNEANKDSLTNLYNRRYADVYFKNFKDSKEEIRACMAIADIDNFKQVNDTYGHEVGDRVLKAVAETFRKNLRATDLVFRWGGEEFLLILNNVDVTLANNLFNQLRKKISKTVVIVGDYPLSVTITIGFSKIEDREIEKTIIKCDKNLYIGKRSGKNKVVGDNIT